VVVNLTLANVIVHAVNNNLVDVVVLSEVNSGLVENVELVAFWTLLDRNANFDLGEAGDETELVKDLVLVDLISRADRLSERLDLLNESHRFSWTKTTQKLKLIVHVVMIDDDVEINSNFIELLNVDFFKLVNQTSLVDVLLKRMKFKVQSLILTQNWTPEIDELIHWILLNSCKTYGLLQNKRMVLEKLLRLMA